METSSVAVMKTLLESDSQGVTIFPEELATGISGVGACVILPLELNLRLPSVSLLALRDRAGKALSTYYCRLNEGQRANDRVQRQDIVRRQHHIVGERERTRLPCASVEKARNGFQKKLGESRLAKNKSHDNDLKKRLSEARKAATSSLR